MCISSAATGSRHVLVARLSVVTIFVIPLIIPLYELAGRVERSLTSGTDALPMRRD